MASGVAASSSKVTKRQLKPTISNEEIMDLLDDSPLTRTKETSSHPMNSCAGSFTDQTIKIAERGCANQELR
eukprot:919325-Lingulodinium_polyedra.AAC.1